MHPRISGSFLSQRVKVLPQVANGQQLAASIGIARFARDPVPNYNRNVDETSTVQTGGYVEGQLESVVLHDEPTQQTTEIAKQDRDSINHSNVDGTILWNQHRRHVFHTVANTTEWDR